VLLASQLATGGTRTRFAQSAIRIKALVPIIPEDAHHALIIPLDFHRVKYLTGVSHRKPLAPVKALSMRERARETHLYVAPSTDAPLTRLPG
jgi:hypothetical protein